MHLPFLPFLHSLFLAFLLFPFSHCSLYSLPFLHSSFISISPSPTPYISFTPVLTSLRSPLRPTNRKAQFYHNSQGEIAHSSLRHCSLYRQCDITQYFTALWILLEGHNCGRFLPTLFVPSVSTFSTWTITTTVLHWYSRMTLLMFLAWWLFLQVLFRCPKFLNVFLYFICSFLVLWLSIYSSSFFYSFSVLDLFFPLVCISKCKTNILPTRFEHH